MQTLNWDTAIVFSALLVCSLPLSVSVPATVPVSLSGVRVQVMFQVFPRLSPVSNWYVFFWTLILAFYICYLNFAFDLFFVFWFALCLAILFATLLLSLFCFCTSALFK